MAVRKKSKRPVRKATRKVASPRKGRKAIQRAAHKRVVRAVRPAKAGKAERAELVPVLAPMIKPIDESSAPRCRSRIPVEIDIAGRRERGAIVDMSSSGARIVGVQMDLPPGTPLQLRYSASMTPVSAEFVRATDDGFAVKILPR